MKMNINNLTNSINGIAKNIIGEKFVAGPITVKTHGFGKSKFMNVSFADPKTGKKLSSFSLRGTAF